MNIVLVGIQGSGKGTLVLSLEKYLKFDLVSVGQLLRDEIHKGSDLGKKIEKITTEGKLVDLDMVLSAIENKLKNKSNDITIFDGFPRNLEQLEELDKICKVDLVIYLNLSEEVAIKRTLDRICCSNCGFITKTSEVNSKICPKCSGILQRREDDELEAIQKRFNLYYSETYPILEVYKKRGIVAEINADQNIDNVLNDVMKVLSDYNKK